VLSRTTTIPGRAWRVIASVAAMTYAMSGSRVFDSGVGTAIEIASHSRSRVSSAVAVKRPACTCAATSAAATSWMCDWPPFSRSTTRWLTS
jgi:hypothetical protein